MKSTDDSSQGMCRVCRGEETSDKPLFHPCVCTGSIKFVHEDCLVRWLRYSRKQTCEVCKHPFSFVPLYKSDMPAWLPLSVLTNGFFKGIRRTVRTWLHFSLVFFSWIIVVPLTAFRIYRSLFSPSVTSVFRLPLDLISTENVLRDCLYGFIIVIISLIAFISFAWLKDQIIQHGPDWLKDQEQQPQQHRHEVEQLRAVAQAQPQPDQPQPDQQPAPLQQPQQQEQHDEQHPPLRPPQQQQQQPQPPPPPQQQQQPQQQQPEREEQNGQPQRPIRIQQQPVLQRPQMPDGRPRRPEQPGQRAALPANQRVFRAAQQRAPNQQQQQQQRLAQPIMRDALQEDSDSTDDDNAEQPQSQRPVIPVNQQRLRLQQQQRALIQQRHQQQQQQQQEQQQEQQQQQQQQQPRPAEPIVQEVEEESDSSDNDDDDDDGNDDNDNHLDADDNQPAQDNQDPLHWQPPEELTWQRMVGLDGSLVFLEHVFWVISLNCLFVLLFAFCPYYFGHIFLRATSLSGWASKTHFEGVCSVFFGYCAIAFSFYLIQSLCGLLGIVPVRRIMALGYFAIKVGLLFFIEIGIFPIFCGLCLNVCSLKLFGVTWRKRLEIFNIAPGTFVFSHWLSGMVYIFYFASLVLLLREVVRPGLLWFLRNINDPEFSPVNDMVNQSFFKHLKRFLFAIALFGFLILLMVYVPVSLATSLSPSLIPYKIYWRSDSALHDWVYITISLNVLIPQVMETSGLKKWITWLARHWCLLIVCFLPDMKSYLLGDDGRREMNTPALPGNANLGARHHALAEHQMNTEYQPYERPPAFHLKLVIVLLVLSLTVCLIGLAVFTVPVFTGRIFLAVLGSQFGSFKVHDLYSVMFGVYIWWTIATGVTYLIERLSGRQEENNAGQGQLVQVVFNAADLTSSILVRWTRSVVAHCRQLLSTEIVVDRLTNFSKYLMEAVVFYLILPIELGLLFENLVLIPVRSPLQSTAVHLHCYNYCNGFLLTKLLLMLICWQEVGPQFAYRQNLVQFFDGDIVRFTFGQIVAICGPLFAFVTLCLVGPYSFCFGVLPLFGLAETFCKELYHVSYLFILLFTALCCFVRFQIDKFFDLCTTIRNERYLIGRQLLNYEKTG